MIVGYQERAEILCKQFPREHFTRGFSLNYLIEGHSKVLATVKEEVIALTGFANGGFLVTLGDAAAVYAAMSLVPEGHTKLLQTSFHFCSPAHLGMKLRADANVIKETGYIIWISATISNAENNELIAFGDMMFKKPSKRS